MSHILQFSSVQSLSRVWLFATPWTAACQASLSITISRSSLTHDHWVGDAIQPSHPLPSPFPPAPRLLLLPSGFIRTGIFHSLVKVQVDKKSKWSWVRHGRRKLRAGKDSPGELGSRVGFLRVRPVGYGGKRPTTSFTFPTLLRFIWETWFMKLRME